MKTIFTILNCEIVFLYDPGDKLGTWQQCGLYNWVKVSCAWQAELSSAYPYGVDLVYIDEKIVTQLSRPSVERPCEIGVHVVY